MKRKLNNKTDIFQLMSRGNFDVWIQLTHKHKRKTFGKKKSSKHNYVMYET